jgi:PD-(D/E)XK nuclease superfamily
MKPPTSYQGPDGRWVHRFRQSDLNRVRKCGEQHRRHMLGLDIDRTSLAMLVGTAVHAGIEAALRDADIDLPGAIQHAYADFERNYDEAEHMVLTPLKEDPALAIHTCLHAWWQDVLPLVFLEGSEGVRVEERFSLPVHEDENRIIVLEGTADLVTADRIWDWKTGSGTGRYRAEAWKYRRGYESTQHVVYSAAMALLDGADPTIDADSLRPFSYVRLSRSGHDTDFLTIQPQPADVRFLLRECLSLAQLIEARPTAWPLGATGWWCAPQWCPSWDACRGATGGMRS